MGNIQRKDYDTSGNPAIRNPDWMSSIPDGKFLSDLSIPGTHDSLSLYGGPLVQCHSWSLSSQYEAGIRFVDVRCRHFQNSLPIHHGLKFQYCFFNNVLDDTINFLCQHPRETILMRIKKEYEAAYNTESFTVTLDRYIKQAGSSWFWNSSTIPYMSEARGKIIILQNFAGPLRGIPYDSLNIEDEYNLPTLFDIDWKWSVIKYNLIAACNASHDKMYLTYCSGASMGAYPNAVANRINSRLFNYLEKNEKAKIRWGIIALDFPGAELVQLILHSNWIQ